MFVTLRAGPYLLWRAVDEHRWELDVLVQKRRDKAAAKRFFRRVLRSNPVPARIITDRLRSYPGYGRYSRARSCEARFCRDCRTGEQPCRKQPPADPQAQNPDVRFSRAASQAGDSLMLRSDPLARSQMRAECHRALLKERFATWHSWTEFSAVENDIG